MIYIKAAPGVPFSIGRQGEHKARQVQFNIAPWHAVYGEGVVQLLFQRPGEEAPYPVAVDRQDTQVLWTVTSTDTEIKSRPSERIYGYAELRYYVNDALAKSEISTVSIYDALDAPGEIPDPPGKSWLDQALEAGAAAKNAAAQVQETNAHPPKPGSDGFWLIWNADLNEYAPSDIPLPETGGASGPSDAVRYGEQTLTKEQQTQARTNINALGADELPTAVEDALEKAKESGEFDGPAGPSGADGVSVTSVEQTTKATADGGVNVITVTLSNGKKSTFEVKNGSTGPVGPTGGTGPVGPTGATGAAGEDGVSVSSVTQITTSTEDGGTNTIRVTLSNGQTFDFQVRNGSKGAQGPAGADGKTPEKGVDYFTDADKSELVEDVLAALPTWTGGAY